MLDIVSVNGVCLVFVFFFFKQKTAYEIYQCDWSSDVCSSDLADNIVVITVPNKNPCPYVCIHMGNHFK